ncbi:MAG TPA: glycosyltransferase family 39 protein [Candidatus Angelobacter sp.]|nr:glycosyltransferase family 39 protein [Candidatus Angelobacter sp.]
MAAATPIDQAQTVPAKGALFYAAATVIVTVIMCLRIAATDFIFTQTFDESAHIACGLRWLDKGDYECESAHPPLGRVVGAVGPYLAGERSHAIDDPIAEGNEILGQGSHYRLILALGRLGELPFAVLALAGAWVWARRVFSPGAAFFAALLFSLLPPVLGNSGLVTTDIAVTAGCTWAFYAFTRLLEEPGWKNCLAVGFWCAFALVSKFSAVPFLACGFLAIFILYALSSRHAGSPVNGLQVVRWLALASVITVLLVWASYQFSFGPLFTEAELHRPNAHIPQRLIQPGWAHTAVTAVPVPAGRFFRGLGQVWMHNVKGHASYLLGQRRETGWWYFFPVVMAIKTPLGFLALAVCGSAILLTQLRRNEWLSGACVAAAVAMLLVCMVSRIDLGLRHILPIYPLLSVAAGWLVADSMRHFRSPRFVLVLGCLLWCGVDSARAHPDYLAWFNPIAASHPDHFRVDSDFDWGQDLGRLSARLQQLHVPSVTISYFGRADLSHFGLPPFSELSCDGPMHGYVAVSVTNLYYKSVTCPERFHSLQQMKPQEVVGKTIYLYYLP